jgi:hypothetical protein
MAQQPASNAQNASPAPPEGLCAKAVTIYLDASGTMTQPVRNRGNRLPVSDVAQTLLRFINAEGFLGAGDTVTVKYFGSAVRTQAENRQASVTLLTDLADPGVAPGAVAALRSGDLRNLTDFARLFDDLENRVRNASTRRQIIFVASDFAHDPLNNPGCPNDVEPRLQSFASALARIRPRLEQATAGTGDAFRRVEIAGLYAPEGGCASDNAVARQVQEALKTIGMRLYRYDEDAAEAALTINNQLIGTVTARSATEGVVRIGADNRVPFLVSNPNCVDARIVALQFEGGGATPRIDFEPVTVSGATHEVRLELDQLSAIWNRDTRVTPVLAPGTTLNAEPSASFWLGDWMRVRRMTPYVYPRIWREGQTLVAATIERNLRAPAGLTVAGIDAGSRSRLFQLPEGEGEELYLLPFDLNTALTGRLAGTGTAATLGTTGIRLLTDDTTAVANANLPLTAATPSDAAVLIDGIGVGSLAGYVLVILIIVYRTFSRDGDAESRDQLQLFLGRTKKLWGGLIPALLLWIRFRAPLAPDMLMVVLAGWRALAAGLAAFFLIRALLIEFFWIQNVEPRLLPADRAVRFRRTWNTFSYLLACVIAGWVLYSFFWAPASNPSPGISVLRGETR